MILEKKKGRFPYREYKNRFLTSNKESPLKKRRKRFFNPNCTRRECRDKFVHTSKLLQRILFLKYKEDKENESVETNGR